MKVVHVITTLVTGGAERQLELLVERSAADTTTVALYGGGPVADSMRGGTRRMGCGSSDARTDVAPRRRSSVAHTGGAPRRGDWPASTVQAATTAARASQG